MQCFGEDVWKLFDRRWLAPDRKEKQQHVITRLTCYSPLVRPVSVKESWKCPSLASLGIRVVLSCETFKRNVKTFLDLWGRVVSLACLDFGFG